MQLSTTHERPAAPAPPVGRRWLTRALGYGVPVLCAALVIWFAVARPVKVLPRIRELPPFALTDQRGQRLYDADLRGRMVLLSFTHTRCGAPCAPTLDLLGGVRDDLRAQGLLGRELLYLTVSLDPAHDTPADLSILAGQLGADPDSWRFATGDPAEIKALVGGELRIFYGEPDAAGRLEYEPQVILLDGNGTMRARYAGERLDQARMLRDIGLVRAEAGSSGAMRSVYEASHLFLCYPD